MIRNYLSVLTMAMMPVVFKAQKVGVNTDSPTRTLDIDGDLRVRTLNEVDVTDGFLSSFSKEDENNVITKVLFKGVEAFRGSVQDLNGGEIGEENVPGKFSDNSWKYLTFTGSDTDYIGVNNTLLTVKKSGFYTITANVGIQLENEEDATVGSNISYANVTSALAIQLKNRDNKYSFFNASRNNVTVIKGASISKSRINNEYTTSKGKYYNIPLSANVFLTEGSRIYLQIHTFGMPGVVKNYSNFKFKANLSEIKIVKNL